MCDEETIEQQVIKFISSNGQFNKIYEEFSKTNVGLSIDSDEFIYYIYDYVKKTLISNSDNVMVQLQQDMIYQQRIYSLSTTDSSPNEILTKINDAFQDVTVSELDLIHKKRKLADLIGKYSSPELTKIKRKKKSIEDTN